MVGQVTSNSSISDRKNILKTIKCAYDFALENKDVGVVLKINKGKYTINDFKSIRENLRTHLGEIKEDKICLVYGSLNLEELKKLYESKSISCMLSGTRAEGWGLPFIEAAACGLPIIATNHSAYKEFLEDLEVGDLPKFYFSYDWRKSNRWNAKKLHDFIEMLKVKSRARYGATEADYIDKVNIVTHSMGNHICRFYIKKNGL